MAKVTFLGTGLMGAALAEAAARRGDEVTAWNRSAEKARALSVHGVRCAGSVKEAVQGADRVHLVLSDDAAVDAVLEDAGDGLAGAKGVIDHSTTSPAGTVARAARLEARGVAFLHAPVFMSPAMCRQAGGIMLVAGPKERVEALRPALSAMTGTLEYLGERADLAAAYKLFGNAMIITITAGFADVLAMAAELGIPAGEAHALFGKFNPANTLAYRGANMAKGEYAASFELSMARKDTRLMIEAAAGGELAVLPAIAARMDALVAAGHGARDLGVLAIGAVPEGASKG